MKKLSPNIPFKTNELTVRYGEKNSRKHTFKINRNNCSFDKETNTYTWTTDFIDSVCPKFDNLPKIKSDMGGDIYVQSLSVAVIEVKVFSKEKSSGIIKVAIFNSMYSFYGNGFQLNETTNFLIYRLEPDGSGIIPYKNYGAYLRFPLQIPMKIKGYGKNGTNQNEDIAKFKAYIYSL